MDFRARSLVLAACAGPQSHGEYMSGGVNQDVEAWVCADVGTRVRKKAFEQTSRVLEKRCPGVGVRVGV